ncbi:CoA transferase [Myxococcota bacterium]|nr:CoA transferase [Myxococcota bacterium]
MTGEVPAGSEGALTGVRVLDLGLLVQAPQAAQLLGDLGADVIKIELPGMGDQGRWIPISLEDLRPPFFIGCNRGKRSVTLDLRMEAGRDVFLKLVETADVVLANFVPGTLEGWGLGYDVLSARNPRIILGCGSTFGPVGRDSKRKGADIAGQASGGLIEATGTGPDDMGPVGITLADHLGSQNLANGVLAALFARERTGRGQVVEVSLLGGQIFAQASEYSYAFMTGKTAGHGAGGHNLIPMVYGLLPTSDGHIVIVGVQVPERARFFALIGRSDLEGVERYMSLLLTPEVRRELFEDLAVTFREKTTAEWESILEGGGFRYAAVRTHLEVADDPAVYENGYLQHIEHPDWGPSSAVGCPIRLSDTPARPGQVAPELGQHTEEVLLEHGFDWEQIAALREQGAL